ncbi:RNA polymerase subunit sigma-70 [Microvirga arabica]|uniref:RNA polymerase subunit sigma-70 n=2 Tax=Microvirga arabica TaxID=1128671 RepID=A0ABV6YDT1_9HYPH|nr:RNA polymerase subunit sigma-70 [Microvirga arabica]MBM1175279.1 RNA polymerase subunit sigma-70 [Microvirga arabica]
MTTLKEFEEALREQGMHMALAILEKLKERDRAKRTIRPARRIAGKKMTPELARRIIELNQTSDMTQQEIAFQLGVNQGRVNEVLKRGKWLEENPTSEEAVARDRAKARIKKTKAENVPVSRRRTAGPPEETPRRSQSKPRNSSQLSIEEFINSAMAPEGNQSH